MGNFYTDLKAYSKAQKFWLNEALNTGDEHAKDMVAMYSKAILEVVKQRAEEVKFMSKWF